MASKLTILSSILKAAQFRQIQIRSILKNSMSHGLRSDLSSFLHEYSAIEAEADYLAFCFGWNVEGLEPFIKLLIVLYFRYFSIPNFSDNIKVRLLLNKGPSFLSVCNLYKTTDNTSSLQLLCQKFSDCEKATIRCLQTYL